MKVVRKPQDKRLDYIAEMYRNGLSLRQIANRTKKTHQAVASILQARSVEMRKIGRKPHDQVLDYKGLRYTWTSKGYWRCTKFNDRHNLARTIWEQNFGKIPAGHEVFYKDGNRFNLAPKNLGCLSRSERQRQRLTDENYKTMFYAYGCYARLRKHISDSMNPDRVRERAEKTWKTRRERTDPSESARKAHETRRKLYGKSGVKDPEAVRQKLSLAHMGKPHPKARKK